MTAIDLVNDLVALECLADGEEDGPRRRQLLAIFDRLAMRSEGAKVSEAATVLRISVPTVRAWASAGVLTNVRGSRPARVTYDSLAAVRRALDEVRSTRDNQSLLDAVARHRRDRAAPSGVDVDEAVGELHTELTRPLAKDDPASLIPDSRPSQRRQPRVVQPGGPLGERVWRHRRQVRQVVTSYGLGGLRVFGSVARGEDGPDSDIDLLVDVPAGVGLLTLGRCQAELEALLGASVDLVPAADLKPDVASEVLAESLAL